MQASLSSSPLTGETTAKPQPWLSSPTWDLSWIMGPAFISASCALLLKQQMEACQNTPLWVWVCFLLLVDVAHVYGSLYRTYLDPRAFSKNRILLLSAPLIAWLGGVGLYKVSDQYFWRALMYLAVFHFIRQQFGFMMMYGRKDAAICQKYNWLDRLAIYSATIYPLLYWHTHTRSFRWFEITSFVDGIPMAFEQIGFAFYLIVAALYISKEIFLARQGHFNIPKNLLLIVTAYSWWTCIIAVNSDLAFTITNVVSHGVPYMALIWLYHGTSARDKNQDPVWRSGWRKFLTSNAFVFVAFIGLLAFVEEGFWDATVWREHYSVFSMFWQLPQVHNPALLALLVPFLALPQSTHYLLDGFIWRVKKRDSIWTA